MDVLFVMFPAIVALGFLSSWYDIKKGTIPNALVFPFFAGGIIGYGFLFFFTWIQGTINPPFAITTATNLISALFFSFILWKRKWWPGGDAKLFVLYAFLIPVSTYSFGYVPYFPALALLINTFLPLSIACLLFKAPVMFSFRATASALLTVFSLSWAFHMLPPPVTFFLMLFVTSFIASPVGFFLQGILAGSRLLLDKTIYTSSFVVQFFFWTFLLLAGKQIIVNHAQKAEDTTLPFAPALFAGVLLTFLAQGIFLSLMATFI